MRNSKCRHVCHSPQHASSPVYISDCGASMVCKTGREGRGTGFHLFPCSASHSELRTTQEAKVIMIALWWPFQPWFPHLLRLCVDHPCIILYRWDLLSQQGYVSARQIIPSACLEALIQNYQAAGFSKRSLDSQQLLEDLN